MKTIILIILTVAFFLFRNRYQQPGKSNALVWKDTEGNRVNAHGAGILYYNGTYYMYGEVKKGKTWLVPHQSWEDYRVAAGGVSCYSSKDLKQWKYEGLALPAVQGNPSHDLDTSRVIERPKVIYNTASKKFVMWMHVDKEDYTYSRGGIAVSDRPAGPFTYMGSVQPNGQMLRDMTLFKDDDNRAYLIYSSENNNTMHVCLLNEDYLSPSATYSRILIGRKREAPAMFKHEGKYYLITSGCTGWSPNEASYAVAKTPIGPWTEYGNPCRGAGAATSFGSQGSFVLPVAGEAGRFIFIADRWNKLNLEDSRYLWLPLQIDNGKVVIDGKAR